MIKQIFLFLTAFMPLMVIAENSTADIERIDRKITNLESRVDMEVHTDNQEMNSLERRISDLEDQAGAVAAVAFLSGVLCALWAQHTRRSSLLWFFMGLLLLPITLLVLLYKNSEDLKSGRTQYWTTH